MGMTKMRIPTAIRSALMTANSNRQGETVQAIAQVRRLMQELDLIGPNGGLTRQGSIVREQVMREELDKAFG